MLAETDSVLRLRNEQQYSVEGFLEKLGVTTSSSREHGLGAVSTVSTR